MAISTTAAPHPFPSGQGYQSHQRPTRVEFSRAQIEYLDQAFPEIIGNHAVPADERLWRAAQRSVLYLLKSRVNTGGPI